MYIDFESRFKQLFDDEKFELIEIPIENNDPLKFKDLKKYTDRLKDAQQKLNKKMLLMLHRTNRWNDYLYILIRF